MVQILIVPLLPFPLYHTPLSLHSPHHSIDFDFSLAVFSINSGDRLQQLQRSSPTTSVVVSITSVDTHKYLPSFVSRRSSPPSTALTSTAPHLGCLVAIMASAGPSPGSSPCWPSSPAQMNNIIVGSGFRDNLNSNLCIVAHLEFLLPYCELSQYGGIIHSSIRREMRKRKKDGEVVIDTINFDDL
ncbi:hypothetical protein L6452_30797 [Arctium lappa]|uniref:Uncharacterized protein n=1 Tax=Arctium lappa TaxID=4217 RepID=A0ACB8ZJ54_ARCLA|nr:hypothetical protein L6452_30797 [Arctium lappa]